MGAGRLGHASVDRQREGWTHTEETSQKLKTRYKYVRRPKCFAILNRSNNLELLRALHLLSMTGAQLRFFRDARKLRTLDSNGQLDSRRGGVKALLPPPSRRPATHRFAEEPDKWRRRNTSVYHGFLVCEAIDVWMSVIEQEKQEYPDKKSRIFVANRKACLLRGQNLVGILFFVVFFSLVLC